MKKLFFYLILSAGFFFHLSATTYITTGEGQGLWNDPMSWKAEENEASGVPTPTDNVVIKHYISQVVDNSYVHLGKITVSRSGVYEILTQFDTSATYNYAGPRMEVAGTLMTSNHFSHLGEGELIINSGAWILIGGRMNLESTGGMLNMNASCGGFEINQGLNLAVDQSFVAGNGKMVVWGDVEPYQQIGNMSYASKNEALTNAIEKGISIFRSSENCLLDEAYLKGASDYSPQLRWEGEGLKYENGEVELSWAAEARFGTEFVIERSIDGLAYERMAVISHEIGNESYRFSLPETNSRNYYRIKLYDLRGTQLTSNARKVKQDLEPIATLGIFPNPYQGGELTLEAEGLNPETPVVVRINHMAGTLAMEQVAYSNRANGLSLSALPNLNQGVYIVTLLQGERRYTQRLIIQ